VTEVVSPGDVELVARYADILQLGTRNMQNYALLQEAGVPQAVLLKRGMSSTIEEWLLAAEYILSQGNRDVILCERGIRTFETSTRSRWTSTRCRWRASSPTCRSWSILRRRPVSGRSCDRCRLQPWPPAPTFDRGGAPDANQALVGRRAVARLRGVRRLMPTSDHVSAMAKQLA